MSAYRIAMLGWEFPPFVSGGLGTHCYELTKALSANGTAIDFFMPKTSFNIDAPWAKIYQVDWTLLEDGKQVHLPVPAKLGGSYTAIPNPSVPSPATKPVKVLGKPSGASKSYDMDFFDCVNLYNYLVELLVVKLNAKNPYDLVHCHDWISARAGLAIQRRTGIPFVTTIHSTEYDRTADLWPNDWILGIERNAVHGADKVITVSKRSKSQLESRFCVPPSKIDVVYNAIDYDKFPKDKLALKDSGRESKVVLYHGRLSVQKGVEFFLRAAAKVLSVERDVRFVISGKGDLLPRLVELSIDLGIQDKVSFLGYVSEEQLGRIYATSDVFVLPSVSEPFGIAALEAMASGTPVILSKSSGVSELVKTCLTVDFWDVDEMAAKMLAVLSYPALADELRDNSFCEAKAITWDCVAKKTLASYSSAIENSRMRAISAQAR